MVGFYGITTIVDYLIPNPLYTYISNIYDLVWVGFYCISTIVGYLISNPLYTYISNIYDLVWVGFYCISTIVGYLISNPLYTYIYQICMIWFGLGFIAYQPYGGARGVMVIVVGIGHGDTSSNLGRD